MILLSEFSYMMGVYLIALVFMLLYLKRKIGKIFHSIEEDKNITDLLFLKLLLDFIYKNNLLINLENVMSNLRELILSIIFPVSKIAKILLLS